MEEAATAAVAADDAPKGSVLKLNKDVEKYNALREKRGSIR